MEKQYRKELEQIRLTEASKAMLVHKLTNHTVKETSRVHRSRWVATLASIVLIIIVSGTVSAVGIPILKAYLGGNGYEQSAVTIGKSMTQDGWTVTLTDCVGDDRYLYLGIEVVAPEKMILDEIDYYIEDFEFSFEGIQDYVMTYQIEQVPDQNTKDNSIQFILWIQGGYGENSFNNRSMDLSLKGIHHKRWDGSDNGYERLYDYKKEWAFKRIPIQYPDLSIEMKPNVAVNVLDAEVILTKVEVSPIGIVVRMEGDSLKGHHEWVDRHEAGWPDCFGQPQINLYNKEGKLLEPDEQSAPFGVNAGSMCSGGVRGSDEEGILKLVQSYGYLLDMNDLGWIEVEGVRVELNQ